MFAVFSITVIYLTSQNGHTSITVVMPPIDTRQAVLISVEEQTGKYAKRCDHGMLMRKDGGGHWYYVKPEGAENTGRATVKCK